MCNTSHPVTNLPSGAEVGNNPEKTGTLPIGTEPTSTTMQPTKFAKLLKVVMPLVQGGLIGASSNPRQNQGGEEAQQFFARQAALDTQKQNLTLRQQQQQSEDLWRKAEARRADAQMQGAGRVYQGTDQDSDVRHNYKITPEGTREDLGENPLPDQFTPEMTARGLMVIDRRKGTIEQPTDLHPEQTGSLPLPNQNQTLPFKAPEKEKRPIILGQGQEAFDPTTHEPIAKGQNKTYAPPRGSTKAYKPDPAKIENWAKNALDLNSNDADKAVSVINNMKSIPDSDKAALRNRIREMSRKSNKRRFTFSAPEAQQMGEAPTGQ